MPRTISRRIVLSVALVITAGLPASLAGAASARRTPTLTWTRSSLTAGSRTRAADLVRTNSTGRKSFTVSGECTLQRDVIIATTNGGCKVRASIAATSRYAARTSTKYFLVRGGSSTPPRTTTPPTTATPTTSTAPTTSTTTPGGTGTVANGCASTYVFPDLSKASGAGSGYAKPSVSASCSNGSLTMTSNGMIAYTFEPKTPNALTAQSYTWSVTTSPSVAAQTTSIRNQLGTLGFSVTGIPLYGPTEGPVPPNQAYGDPVYNNLLDSCKGHTGYGGAYHYHSILAVSSCYLDETIIGYALDGFPIYSNPNWAQKSGYSMTGNPVSNSWDAYTYTGTGTLDACNGKTGSDGSYRYYVTESFPYIIGCYKGTPRTQSGAAAAPMVMPRVQASSASMMGAGSRALSFLCDLTRL